MTLCTKIIIYQIWYCTELHLIFHKDSSSFLQLHFLPLYTIVAQCCNKFDMKIYLIQFQLDQSAYELQAVATEEPPSITFSAASNSSPAKASSVISAQTNTKTPSNKTPLLKSQSVGVPVIVPMSVKVPNPVTKLDSSSAQHNPTNAKLIRSDHVSSSQSLVPDETTSHLAAGNLIESHGAESSHVISSSGPRPHNSQGYVICSASDNVQQGNGDHAVLEKVPTNEETVQENPPNSR